MEPDGALRAFGIHCSLNVYDAPRYEPDSGLSGGPGTRVNRKGAGRRVPAPFFHGLA